MRLRRRGSISSGKIAIVIIDASVAFKLVYEEPDSAAAMAWVGRTELVAPTLIHSEVANALWKKVRRKELVDDGAIDTRIAELAFYIRTVEETAHLPRALKLAIELGHPVYDCVYLALAEAAGEELLTADRKLLRAVENGPFAVMVRALENED